MNAVNIDSDDDDDDDDVDDVAVFHSNGPRLRRPRRHYDGLYRGQSACSTQLSCRLADLRRHQVLQQRQFL